jgi:hypothetical protein
MPRLLRALAASVSLSAVCLAGGDTDSTIWNRRFDVGSIDRGFVVQIPTGASDYFNSAFRIGIGDLIPGLPLTGIALSVADSAREKPFPGWESTSPT